MRARPGIIAPAVLSICLALGGLATRSRSASAADRQPIEVSVLSYNVHGLPEWIVRDLPAMRLHLIGELVNNYDVALLQEDFTYHGPLVESAMDPIVETGNGARLLLRLIGAPFCGSCGSGLTMLARLPADRVVAIDREPFRACSGWLGSGNDCWVEKGLMRMRLRLGEAVDVDFYDLHLDAGEGASDRRVRAKQLEILSRHIAESSKLNAVIVGGDFNASRGSPADERMLEEFVTGTNLLAGFPRSHGPHKPDGFDHIFYRSGVRVALELVGSGVAEDFVHDGKPLSDHRAIWARFRARRR